MEELSKEQSEEDKITCDHCDNEVNESDEFCPNCGGLFAENTFCINHPAAEADGVCIICCQAYCGQCAGRVKGLYLCRTHEVYEIIEGMARIYGGRDFVQAQNVCSYLEGEGFHPFFYSPKGNILGSAEESALMQTFSGYELKVLVPCQEVLEAEKALQKMDETQSSI